MTSAPPKGPPKRSSPTVTPPVAATPIPHGPVQFGRPQEVAGHRNVLYGPGGIGKTTLAMLAPGPVAFFDLDDSLPVLGIVEGVQVVQGIKDWGSLRGALQSPGWDNIKTIVIDTATKAEELATAHAITTIPHEKGHMVSGIEGYGFGKGTQHVYDVFLTLLADLDAHCRAGRHVILICHDCTANVPNPSGEDWIRYEPRLQSPTSGKSSIRLRVREWADHVFCLGYDVIVSDGKGRGTGSRTLYPTELPICMAKSRRLSQPIVIEKGSPAVWEFLKGGAK